jgi:hypothetical protein
MVEPYSLVFKQRKDGVAQEYFYCYDTTGGHSSGPSIKSFTRGGIQRMENTDIHFEPRYTVELAKAGDRETAGYFARRSACRGRRGRGAAGRVSTSAGRTRCSARIAARRSRARPRRRA